MIDDNKENVGPTLHNFKLTTSIQSFQKYETKNIYASLKSMMHGRKLHKI
jgi:hypothetical protein